MASASRISSPSTFQHRSPAALFHYSTERHPQSITLLLRPHSPLFSSPLLSSVLLSSRRLAPFFDTFDYRGDVSSLHHRRTLVTARRVSLLEVGSSRRAGMGGRNAYLVMLLSVLLLVYVNHSRADFGWSSTADVVFGWSRGRSMEEGALGESLRRVLASSSSSIAYGALTAGRTPCPPQSGRSYYTPNCASATGPVRPYQRGCSAITRCARG